MHVRLWGTRGSIAAPGPDTARYGGNTSCAQIYDDGDDHVLLLDAGSGIRPAGMKVPWGKVRVDILLTHLHLDHILGLGFFAPLHNPDAEIHIWGPASQTLTLEERLMRYLSPPYFPLHFYELPSHIVLHEVFNEEAIRIGSYSVDARLVIHPGPTVGFRITGRSGRSVAYLPDHEPALGLDDFPLEPNWTSGYDLAAGVDLLIHDSQYSHDEYESKVGWGHSTIEQALRFGQLCEIRKFVTFHYDPAHTDDQLDALIRSGWESVRPSFEIINGSEGQSYAAD